MGNPFKFVAHGLADLGKYIADAVRFVFGTARKVEKVMQAEKPLEKPFIDAVVTCIGDIETLMALASSAVGQDGLNFPADSAAYKQLMQTFDDLKALAPIAEDALAVLEGKPEPHPLPAEPAESKPAVQPTVTAQKNETSQPSTAAAAPASVTDATAPAK